jgi:integration host factor subunit alpha
MVRDFGCNLSSESLPMHSLASDVFDPNEDFDAPAGAVAVADDSRTLTKAELADLLFERVGLNKREAKDMVETFFEEIRDALERGDMVKLSGFGNFQVRNKPQRPGRNPKTGEAIPIAARRVVTFHASQKLKSMVEQVALREQSQS